MLKRNWYTRSNVNQEPITLAKLEQARKDFEASCPKPEITTEFLNILPTWLSKDQLNYLIGRCANESLKRKH